MKKHLKNISEAIQKSPLINSLVALGARLYLAPVFFFLGWEKLNNFNQTVILYGDSFQIPFPLWFVIFLISVQLFGALFLLVGIFVRSTSFVLFIITLGAIIKLHLPNGWYLIGQFSNLEVRNRLVEITGLIQQNGDFDYLTQIGPIAILTNGMELKVAYLLLLSVLFVLGSGKININFFNKKKR